MIIDSSALLAILLEEEDCEVYAAALSSARDARMSAANYFECSIVADGKRNPRIRRRFDDLVRDSAVTVAPVTEAQARIAREAYRDYGRGSGHPAGLNFGDCFAYALARDTGEPLLFKGEDFAHTDLRSALA